VIHHDLQLPAKFDGARYDHDAQYKSLSGQLKAIYQVLLCGERMTLEQVMAAVAVRLERKHLSATSVSANIRNLRKCGFNVHGDYGDNGVFEYWMETESQGRLF
jgi:hypothetical protein